MSDDPVEKRPVHSVLSLVTLGAGVILLTYMISVESEPGAIPLLLVVVGIGWYTVARVSTWSNRNKPPLEN